MVTYEPAGFSNEQHGGGERESESVVIREVGERQRKRIRNPENPIAVNN